MSSLSQIKRTSNKCQKDLLWKGIFSTVYNPPSVSKKESFKEANLRCSEYLDHFKILTTIKRELPRISFTLKPYQFLLVGKEAER